MEAGCANSYGAFNPLDVGLNSSAEIYAVMQQKVLKTANSFSFFLLKAACGFRLDENNKTEGHMSERKS